MAAAAAAPFPATFVINLREHRRRLYTVKREFASRGWPVPLQRIAGVKLKDGVGGCRRAHVKALEAAVEAGVPWAVILEDDAHLRADGLARFKRLLPTLWERRSDFDIFLGGVSHLLKKTRKVKGTKLPLYKVRGYATHFYLVPAHAFKKLIRLINTSPGPVDFVYKNHARIWSTCPPLATQHAHVSSIINKYADYSGNFRHVQRAMCGSRLTRKHKK
jgi:GR25 family glycosyltransferase involved in LPS biosynthesis